MTRRVRLRASPERNFESLYRRHAADVYRYALMMLDTAADAEDVTQTTFLNAYRALLRGERPREPRRWLQVIAHNLCLQHFRQAARRPRQVALEDDTAAPGSDEPDVRVEDLTRAMRQIPVNQRAALVMRELEGRPIAEIADILGVSSATDTGADVCAVDEADGPGEICDELDDDLVDGQVEDEGLLDVGAELEPDGEACSDPQTWPVGEPAEGEGTRAPSPWAVIGLSLDATQQLASAGKMRHQVSASTGVERRPHEVVKFNGKLCGRYASELGQGGSERLGLSIRHKRCELRCNLPRLEAVCSDASPGAPSTARCPRAWLPSDSRCRASRAA